MSEYISKARCRGNGSEHFEIGSGTIEQNENKTISLILSLRANLITK